MDKPAVALGGPEGERYGRGRGVAEAPDAVHDPVRVELEALADGLDGKEIASKLYISVQTERNHMASILAKLGTHSRLQALVFAARHGVVDIR